MGTVQPVVQSWRLHQQESIFIGSDMNGHVGRDANGYGGAHGGMGFGTRNAEGERILEFGDAVGMVGCNTFFKKEDSKLITYQSGDNRSMIDYRMVRKTDRCLVKVISSKECVPQHRMAIGRLVLSMKPQKNTHYKTADTDIQHCIQYITNIPHSVLTGDVNAHSTLWYSYTDDHRGQLIADVISNSDHITLNTNTPTRVPNTIPQQTSSSDITTVSNTIYNRTSWTTQHGLSSDHLPIITTINIRHDYRLQQYRRPFTNYKKTDWTQFTEDTESAFAQTTIPTNIHPANRIFTNIILMADKHTIPKGKMHSNCRLLPEDIVWKITQRNNIRRANTCDPALKLLNEEISSDIQKHKQNIWKEHVDAHWDHRHNTHTLWKTIHGYPTEHHHTH